MQWLASPEKMPPQPIEMAVVFDDPIGKTQNQKEKNPEKAQNEKTHKKEKKTDHYNETKPIKIQNKQASTIDKDGAPEITSTQSKYTPVFRGRMRPDPSISHHPAFPMLQKYATEGCPVDCGEPWTREHLDAAVNRGPHISARSSQAAACLREEALEKVQQGYAEIVNWDDIKENPHPNLKISPLAAVPHKSRLFRAILDLSYRLRLHGIYLPSVNEATIPMSDHKAMEQMGKVLWRLVTTVAATKNNHGPIVFAKWDIKDGFWRLVVSDDDAWHFCYVLPRLSEDDPIQIVKPTCLQMGWSESPPLFCSASETARDAAQELLEKPGLLPPHTLESFCLPEDIDLPSIERVDNETLTKLLDVYMDDFIGLAQAPTHGELLHFTRAVLHGIHTVFPPPGPSEDPDDEPISVKKLKQGDGLWSTKKEILGWLFDGVSRCLSLPDEKVKTITATLTQLTRKKTVRFGELEKVNGKLMHATIGIPNGRGLLSPIIATIMKKPAIRNYKDRTIRLNQATRQAMKDWIALLPAALKDPTPCEDLVPATADYGGYCDASKQGAGGVWFGIEKELPAIVWRVQFPLEIQNQLVSVENPRGKISNSDLEMVGLLLQWLVLENFADLAHKHVACWCDNTPTVAWASKLLATKATRAAHILRILALRMIHRKASPLTTLHVPGEMNKMADFASRSFLTHPDSRLFLAEFHNRFPLPQEASWIACQLPNKLLGRVFSTLSMPTPTLGSWHRLTQQGSVTGGTGENFFHPVSTRTFRTWLQQNALLSFRVSLDGSGKELSVAENKSRWAASRQPSAPLARPSNWMGLPTRCTAQERPTTLQR